MTKKSEKEAFQPNPTFVFGLDENGKARGARFPTLKDDVAKAAIDMNCYVVHSASEEFAAIGSKLPVGRVYASGKAFIPSIRHDLCEKLMSAKGENYLFAKDETVLVETKETTPPVPCLSPITSGLPKSWESIGPGHMVLIHESPSEGWWEAVVAAREDEILTLRFRDYPKVPHFQRHISAVALVNPGLA